ncbi:MAG: prepilin-type N-terminal cleavage/methylation domain-containing protein [Clostridiales Family XIII bacterium]|jgi:prepilin-type N-terminal cleavage/methylation domain-containing protein|nr:prepilin-type N-terminal cleavage/methylation domain-containing protein [Clostridiales Family XIII bacterium]
MNMILKKRLADKGVTQSGGMVMRRRAGFTLVEVIVVLVILAILAAIAIPALTGYIDKAEDKKWIADARNHVVAARTVLDDAYAAGELSATSPSAYIAYEANIASKSALTTWNLNMISHYPDANFNYFGEASKLIGETDYPVDDHLQARFSKRMWYLRFVGPKGSHDLTALLSAEGFVYQGFPNGYAYPPTSAKPAVVVTYRLAPIAASSYLQLNLYSRSYDPNAGYEVYHFTK